MAAHRRARDAVLVVVATVAAVAVVFSAVHLARTPETVLLGNNNIYAETGMSKPRPTKPMVHHPHHPGLKTNAMTAAEYEAKLGKDPQGHPLHKGPGAKKGRQEMLWENYFPGYAAIRARYQRTKMLLNARSKRMGRNIVKDGKELHSKSMANPYIFCKKSFPPNGYYDQAEFHSCLQALNVPKVDLKNLGESDVATDITGAPAGLHQPDGPGSLSPGSDGWSRW